MENDIFDYAFEDLIPDEIGGKHFNLIRQIKPAIFEDFLLAKTARSSCLSCGSDKLFIPHTVVHPEDPDSEDYSENDEVIYVTPQYESSKHFRVYTTRYEICCMNCGFVFQYLAHPVVRWAMVNKGVTGELI
ncbi:hypothetical protein GWD52_13955 [Enterobacteriaceae bacterium 4M9]|nr:hypothetical protein [Enterobacteriaceae bacterium 4M9]